MTDIEDLVGAAGADDGDLDIEGALREFHEQSEPVPPTIQLPAPGDVVLLHGLPGEGEKRFVRSVVRELTGRDEEVLSRLDRAKDDFYILWQDLVLRRAVQTIGLIEIEGNPQAGSLLGQLLLGDRNLLYIGVCIATGGTSKEFEEYPCQNCEALNDFSVDVTSLFDVTPMPPEGEVFDVETRHGMLRMRHARGDDQLAVYQVKRNQTTSERNSQLMAGCVVSLDGREVPKTLDFIRDLGLKDRAKIVDQMVTKAPGPQFKTEGVEVSCHQCGDRIPLVFGWADLL